MPAFKQIYIVLPLCRSNEEGHGWKSLVGMERHANTNLDRVSDIKRISSTGRARKTPPENTCITGKGLQRHKSFEYVSTTTSKLP